MATSTAPMFLDPIVKYQLQKHLVNCHHGVKTSALKIGTFWRGKNYSFFTDQLSSAVKISTSEKVSACFRWDGKPQSYPDLPDREKLSCCLF